MLRTEEYVTKECFDRKADECEQFAEHYLAELKINYNLRRQRVEAHELMRDLMADCTNERTVARAAIYLARTPE
ncbi:hypothetical protein IB275_30400 [Pseudomonas sp. PDM21]|uniref:hypothetical protein n=1 Tax=Pseudomonas sp. PDM21 TaxID=2769257 RepID=UPI00177C0815|nr:hypothetical protein [Pseudomonas sp. PDM21]MBD9674927.1 hypothetical protein [Pseudomonas sp. PDM21]